MRFVQNGNKKRMRNAKQFQTVETNLSSCASGCIVIQNFMVIPLSKIKSFTLHLLFNIILIRR